ncbi:WD40 repeat domain-containing protein [Kitasatospora sp. NPDC002227]|uniref:WD40 repeat domain-containing protein n=1 Tax=Kitasatospora sp. NPDC002227 TaxID=3154773 RepID=UPI0033313C73
MLLVTPPGGNSVILSGDEHGTVHRWDAATGDPVGGKLCELDSMAMLLTSLVLEDGRLLVACGTAYGEIRCFDVATGEPVGRSINTGNGTPAIAAISTPEGPLLLASSDDGIVQQWDVNTGEIIDDSLEGVSVATAMLSDGSYALATGQQNGDINILRTGGPRRVSA